jgi:hypothetical protein
VNYRQIQERQNMTIDSRTSREVSRALNEALYGTIKPANHWFLLEYNGIYTHEAWKDARIPVEVKEKLDNYPSGRPLLVRQPNHLHAHDRQVTFFAINAAAEIPAIYRLELDSYGDIMELDLDALLAGEIVEAQNEALYVVCTNGKRDQCCSQFGLPLYNALANNTSGLAWQSSHIGGHRLAATMYCFPHAICYGFLTEADAPNIIESYSQGRLLLNKLRGHAIWDKPIQVAEYFLRREWDNDRITDFRLIDFEEKVDTWLVRFDVKGTSYEVEIASAEPLMVLATTGDEQYKAIAQFTFVGYKAL